jgi:hypothetical protein
MALSGPLLMRREAQKMINNGSNVCLYRWAYCRPTIGSMKCYGEMYMNYSILQWYN